MKLNANRVPLLVTNSAWDSVASPRLSFVVNWDDIQVESDAWAYIILLALERYEIHYYKDWAGALGRPRGMVWGGRREEGSGWGTHVYLWRIHFDIWQN